jgi:hypothetical protein
METNGVEAQLLQPFDYLAVIIFVTGRMNGTRLIKMLTNTAEIIGLPVKI